MCRTVDLKVEFCAEAWPDAVGDEAKFIASMLGDDPWTAFNLLGPAVKKDADKLKAWLRQRYATRPDQAMRRVRRMEQGAGESVHKYSTNFQTLMKSTRVKSWEHAQTMLFIDGLQDNLRQGLEARGGADFKTIEETIPILLDVERSLSRGGPRGGYIGGNHNYNSSNDPGNYYNSHEGGSGGWSNGRDNGAAYLGNRGKGGNSSPINDNKCYICKGPHYRRDCPHRGDPAYLKCFSCQKRGHISPNCPNMRSQASTSKPTASVRQPPQRKGVFGSAEADEGAVGDGSGMYYPSGGPATPSAGTYGSMASKDGKGEQSPMEEPISSLWSEGDDDWEREIIAGVTREVAWRRGEQNSNFERTGNYGGMRNENFFWRNKENLN